MNPHDWVVTTEAINRTIPAKSTGQIIQVRPDGMLDIDFGLKLRRAICDPSQVKITSAPKIGWGGFSPSGTAY